MKAKNARKKQIMLPTFDMFDCNYIVVVDTAEFHEIQLIDAKIRQNFRYLKTTLFHH